MSHEQSETVERDGKFYNVYGRNTPKAGQDLPGERPYDSLDEAVTAAKSRSEEYGHAHPEEDKAPGLINRAMQGIKDFNLFDTLHPQGTGSTQRGFNNIYPTPGK
jgi:hypothetical protein